MAIAPPTRRPSAGLGLGLGSTAPGRRSAAHRLGHDPAAAWRHVDVMLLGAVAALAAVGALMVYSATRGPGGEEPLVTSFLMRQGGFVALGVVVGTVVAGVDYRRFVEVAPLAYGAVMVGLFGVLSPLGSSQNGTQAWFQVGSFQLQPSEFTKLALILGLAAVLAQFRDEVDLRRFGTCLGLAVLPLGLIMLQPDLGTAFVLVAITLGLLFVGGAQPRHLGALLLGGVIAVGVVVNSSMLEEYQRDRLTVFLAQDDSDVIVGGSQGEAYNLEQSKIAIGAGGFFGQGLFEGSQTRLSNVPEQHTDFIFTAVGEELGFVGAGSLLALYAVICWRIWRAAQLARDTFGTLVCVGVLAMFLFQLFQNVGMTMGIMPITGIPLPFVSYGGSSTIVAFAAIGLVVNVHARRFS
ncbi:MAG: rod shape-determining protein RodA [Acidimicrobiales bacterium]